MTKSDLEKIVNYIAQQGLKAVRENTRNEKVVLDYLAVLTKNNQEYEQFLKIARGLGEEVEKKTQPTGHTFRLRSPVKTPAGPLKYLKIRKPDPTRPQRGAPDFKVGNYEEFKKNYLVDHHDFSLIIRSSGDLELIELKGVDVLVYFPSKTIDERIFVDKKVEVKLK